MSWKQTAGAVTVFVILCSMDWTSIPATAQEGLPQVEVIQPVHHDVSPPLRDVAPVPPRQGPRRVIPWLRPHPGAIFPLQPDPALQQSTGLLVGTTAGLNFDGLSDGVYGFVVVAVPPDTNGAVGATQFVEWVNLSFAVFSKSTSALVYGPADGSTLWKGFGGPCETDNDGDPIAQYDKAAGRWVMTQLANVSAGPPFYQCVAVSTGSDAVLSTWNRNSFTFSNLNDYPKLGVWPDAYYMSFNMFKPIAGGLLGYKFVGAKTCALDRNAMLKGSAAGGQCFQLSSSYASLLPSDLDGTTPPPIGSPNYFLNFGTNSLRLWKFHVNWVTPANSTFTGPTKISVAPFSPACNGGTCIPQLGTTQQLDSLGDRLMYRLAYRKFSDHESLVVNHSVDTGTGNTGVRWYELQNPGGIPKVFQQGTYAPDSNYRWMGSIAMDKVGDIALGYSVSSSTMHPAIHYTGRVPGDPLGTLESEQSIIDGTGSQLPILFISLSRWGDYSSMSVDPLDDCTFWYTTEYLKTDGYYNWSTRIGSFKFPGCF